MEIASKIIAALRDAHLPPVYGFVNGVWIEKNPADADVLKAWRDAGFPLGNHGWSHMNLNQHTLAEFEDDVLKDEPVIKPLMTGEDWHWFRFPFLAEGDTPEKRAGIRDFFLQHEYRVADVTMSFGDYRWNEPYARCKSKGDEKGVALLQKTYLEAADQSIDYYRQLSHTLLGRDIPYVLLMHIGALDSHMLPQLLDTYRQAGFRFVSLPEAERDPFYRSDIDPSLPPEPVNLEWTAIARGIKLPPHTDYAPLLDKICAAPNS